MNATQIAYIAALALVTDLTAVIESRIPALSPEATLEEAEAHDDATTALAEEIGQYEAMDALFQAEDAMVEWMLATVMPKANPKQAAELSFLASKYKTNATARRGLIALAAKYDGK